MLDGRRGLALVPRMGRGLARILRIYADGEFEARCGFMAVESFESSAKIRRIRVYPRPILFLPVVGVVNDCCVNMLLRSLVCEHRACTRRRLAAEAAWAAPVLSHGLLYVRGANRLVCLELIPGRP